MGLLIVERMPNYLIFSSSSVKRGKSRRVKSDYRDWERRPRGYHLKNETIQKLCNKMIILRA